MKANKEEEGVYDNGGVCVERGSHSEHRFPALFVKCVTHTYTSAHSEHRFPASSSWLNQHGLI